MATVQADSKKPIKTSEVKAKKPKAKVASTPFVVKSLSTGRKKTAVAVVSISHAKPGRFEINKKDAIAYFQMNDLLIKRALLPFVATEINHDDFLIIVRKVAGASHPAQSDAIRHAIAKELVSLFPEKRAILKRLGFLTRDSRIVERKKPGLRKARRKEQFSKR